MKIIWAVNPAESTTPLNQQGAQAVRRLSAHPGDEVEPVFVFGVASDLLYGNAAIKWAEATPRQLEGELERFVAKLLTKGRGRVGGPKVLQATTMSRKGLVDTLIGYAEEQKADLIVCQSQGKSKLSRLFVGSFAETLLSRSKIPVLVIRSGERPMTSIQRILFPTDFRKHATAEFHRVLELAERFRSRVTVFHSIELPADSDYVTGYRTVPQLSTGRPFIETANNIAKKRFRGWEKIAALRGIPVDLVLDDSGRSVWTEVAVVARKVKADLVAIEPKGGPVSVALLGSVTREVVRRAPCPVWVLKNPRRRRQKTPSRAKASALSKAVA